MGLTLCVGIIPLYYSDEADPLYRSDEADEDRLSVQMEFEAINAVLRAAGLPEHHEPEQAQGGAPWDWHLGSYGCLHCLRRVAAYLALRHTLPEPTLEEPKNDPVLQQYYAATRTETRPAPRRSQTDATDPMLPTQYTVTAPRPFSHLMDHTDYDGYYLPIRFAEVLVVPGGWIGSSYALRDECRELAALFGLPDDADLGELDRMREQYPEILKRPGWERYVGECFVCKALMTGAEISIQSGCALAFG